MLRAITILGAGCVEAGALDHLKKIENKTSGHSLHRIDFIYMINLDQRPEKFQRCVSLLEPYGIHPFRFSAVNGWELSLETINDVGVKFSEEMEGGFWGTSYLDSSLEPIHGLIENPGQTYFCHCMSRGAIGIALSHLSVLQDAYDSGYKTVWVMEDDIDIIRDPTILSKLIHELDKSVGKEGWDILFTDCDTRDNRGAYVPCTSHARRPDYYPRIKERFTERDKVDKYFRLCGARYGAYSMIIRRSGMRKILDFIKMHQIFLPYDMDYFLPNNIQMYRVREDIVSHQIHAISDNGGANYLNR